MIFKRNKKTLEEIKSEKTYVNPKDFSDSFVLNDASFWHSDAEEKVYNILKKFIHWKYTIIPHVNFLDVFNIINADKEVSALLRNIVCKYHFDFVIFDSRFQPVLFLEINGSMHTKKSKAEVDALKRKLFSDYGDLNLLEIDLFDSVTDEILEEKIKSTLQSTIDSRRKYRAYCPYCKGALIYKYRKDGTAAFYLCERCENPLHPDKNKTFNVSDIPPFIFYT